MGSIAAASRSSATNAWRGARLTTIMWQGQAELTIVAVDFRGLASTLIEAQVLPVE